jgi:diguanylate cyclase (GGDEF)-like protein/PAS domain S-box-containing protein
MMPKLPCDPSLFGAIVDELSDGVAVLDSFAVTYINSTLADMVGHSKADLVGSSFLDVAVMEDKTAFDKFCLDWSDGKDHKSSLDVNCFYDAGKSYAPASLIFLRVDGEQRNTETIVILKSKVEIQTAEKRFALLEKEFHQILDNMPDVFYRTNADGIFTMVSPACKNILGYDPKELIGTKISDLYAEPAARSLTIENLKQANGKPTKVEATLLRKDGTSVWASTNAYMRFDECHEFIGVEGIARDSTKRRANEVELYRSANTDHLTGLANRLFFNVELARAVAQSSKPDNDLALLYLDLDGFKAVNDTYGHQAGDRLLCEVASRLRKLCRNTDLIARLGGDEFIVLLKDNPQKRDVERIADKIIGSLSASYTIGGEVIDVGVSIGISFFPLYTQDNKEAGDFLRDADRAMYAAKREGTNLVRVNRPNTHKGEST